MDLVFTFFLVKDKMIEIEAGSLQTEIPPSSFAKETLKLTTICSASIEYLWDFGDTTPLSQNMLRLST